MLHIVTYKNVYKMTTKMSTKIKFPMEHQKRLIVDKKKNLHIPF